MRRTTARRPLLVGALILAATAAPAGASGLIPSVPARAATRPAGGAVIVVTRPGAATAELAGLDRRLGASRIRDLPAIRARTVRVGDVDAAIAAYGARPEVAWVGVDGRVRAFDHVPDNRFADGTQWNLQDLTAANPGTLNWHQAYQDGLGAGVKVAVVDTGVGRSDLLPPGGYDGFEHPVTGFDFVNNDTSPDDANGHGTHIAGTIAQRTGNVATLEPRTANSVAGVAPDAEILAVRVLDNEGSGSVSNTAAGILYAVDQGAKVVNLSLGGNYAKPLCDAVTYAVNRGAIVVAASGNESTGGLNPVAYPAACPGALAVGGHQWNAQRGEYSNGSCELAVTAPGGDVTDDPSAGSGRPLADPHNGILQESIATGGAGSYAFFYDSGTSMAAAHVAGAAAALMAPPFSRSASEAARLLRSTARDLGPAGADPEYGAGAVDLAAAVRAARGEALRPYPQRLGYRMVASDGGIFTFGDATFEGSTGSLRLNSPIVGMARTPTGRGYWLVAADGGIFTFGDAAFWGSAGSLRLQAPVVGMAATPTGRGYWLVAADGGIFAFGDAAFRGSTGGQVLNRPIVGMAASRSGQGYWLVASDGGIFAFGDVAFWGSAGGIKLNRPIVGMARTPTGAGYWLVASDGGIFTYGDAAFWGSTGNLSLNQPIVAIAPTCFGQGYWLVARDGGIFSFGAAPFLGSTGGTTLNRPIVGASLAIDQRIDQR